MKYFKVLIVGILVIAGTGVHSYFNELNYIHIFLFMFGSFLTTSGFILQTEAKRRKMINRESERKMREFVMKKKEVATMKEKRQKFKKKLLFWLFVIVVLVVLFFILKGMIVSWFKGLF